jgi:hypothetical protein
VRGITIINWRWQAFACVEAHHVDDQAGHLRHEFGVFLHCDEPISACHPELDRCYSRISECFSFSGCTV